MNDIDFKPIIKNLVMNDIHCNIMLDSVNGDKFDGFAKKEAKYPFKHRLSNFYVIMFKTEADMMFFNIKYPHL